MAGKNIASSCFQKGNYFGKGEMAREGFLVIKEKDNYSLWYAAKCYKGDYFFRKYSLPEIVDTYFKKDIQKGAKLTLNKKRYILESEINGVKTSEIIPKRVVIEDFFRKEVFQVWKARPNK
jgi:hypothetical protein